MADLLRKDIEVLVGANPDELDLLAGKFDASADRIKGLHSEALVLIRQSPWKGGDAEHYEQLWRVGARARLDEAALMLHNAAEALRRNAEQQRKTSEADPDGFGSVGPSAPSITNVPTKQPEEEPEDPEWLQISQSIEEFLSLLGLSKDVIEGTLQALRGLFNAGVLDGDTLSFLNGLAHNDGLVGFFKVAGKVMDVAGPLLGFINDFAEHPDLPLDERLVHSVVETSVKIAVSQGVEAAATAAGTALGSMVGGVGAVPGYMIGKGIGIVLGAVVDQGVSMLDDHFEVTEKIADGGVDFYRYAKEHEFDPGSMAMDKAGDIASDVANGAQEIAGNVVDGAQEIAGDVADGAKEVAGDAIDGAKKVGSALNPFD